MKLGNTNLKVKFENEEEIHQVTSTGVLIKNNETRAIYCISKFLIIAACAVSVVANSSDKRSLRSSTSLFKFLI